MIPPKNIMPRVLLCIAVTTLLLSSTHAVSQNTTTQAEKSFNTFWARFRGALAKNDRRAVASMTKFRALDGTYMTDAQFLAKWYGELQRERRCFARAKPVKDQESYSVFCGERIFVFERIAGAWKFTDIGVND